jgi:hypothetical protein
VTLRDHCANDDHCANFLTPLGAVVKALQTPIFTDFASSDTDHCAKSRGSGTVVIHLVRQCRFGKVGDDARGGRFALKPRISLFSAY